MFFERKDIGRVYVIRMTLDSGLVVHKIGMTKTDRAIDRMMEILRSWFMRFRYVPYTKLCMDQKVFDPAKFEKFIHAVLAHKKYIPHMKVDGYTEMFYGLDEQRILHYLRNFNEENLKTVDDLTETQIKFLGSWLAP